MLRKIFLWCGFVLLAAATDSAMAKSYRLDRVVIMGEVTAHGSLKIEESRTYSFRGRFSWADYRLPLDELGTVTDFSLREDSQVYRMVANKDPGTYQVEQSNSEFYVKWFYRARNETRTFVLNYTVTHAVTKYADVAELYYKFIGEANPKAIDSVRVSIRLPQPADTAFVRAWAHGPLWGELRFEGGQIAMNASPLPARRYWEARVVFPNSWLDDALPSNSEERLPAILADEQRWAREANELRQRELQDLAERRENERKAWPIAAAISAAGLLGIALLYHKFGRGYDVPYRQKIDSTIPDDIHPTLASYLYYQKQMTGNALMAALLHLANRGYLKIGEQPAATGGRRFGAKKPRFMIQLENPDWRFDSSLMNFEASLLEFLFDELANKSGQLDIDDF